MKNEERTDTLIVNFRNTFRGGYYLQVHGQRRTEAWHPIPYLLQYQKWLHVCTGCDVYCCLLRVLSS